MHFYPYAVGLPDVVNLDNLPEFTVSESEGLAEMTSHQLWLIDSGSGLYRLDIVLLPPVEFILRNAGGRSIVDSRLDQVMLLSYHSMEVSSMALVGSGELITGQVARYNVIFRAGVTYRIYVRPSRSGVDFDLQIYDENGNLVEWDVDPDSDALCLLTPVWTGPFQIVVICARGSSAYTVLVEP
jgi:hypothetical protein